MCFMEVRFENDILRSDLKKLEDVKKNKTELAEKAGIARSTIVKMGKNKTVSVDIIVKICSTLHGRIVDAASVLPTDNENI